MMPISTLMKNSIGGLEGRNLKTGDQIGFLKPVSEYPDMDERNAWPEFYLILYFFGQTAVMSRKDPALQSQNPLPFPRSNSRKPNILFSVRQLPESSAPNRRR